MRLLFAFLYCLTASAADIYFAQASAGSNNGTNCANAYSAARFNTADSNWTAGNIEHLCGPFTTQLSIQSAGTSVSKITIKAETGASVKVLGASSCPINANNFSHLIFDGGSNGILAVTGNGTGLATQVSASAFCGVTSWGDIEVKNWELGPFYIHSSLSDVTVDESQVNAFFASALSGDVSIHDNRIHDCGDCILIDGTISGTPAVAIYNNSFVDYNWALGWAPASGGASSLDFHNNDLGSTAAWDTTADQYHHNGIHFFAGIGTAMTASNIYNNYFHGDWGNCCTTNFIFTEFTPINHQNFYNNLLIQHDGNLFPLVNISATNSGSDPGIVSNTFVCGGGSSANTNAMEIGAFGTVVSGVNFENNVVVNCNTMFQELAGVTQAIVDYNAYMVKGPGGNGTWGDASGGFDPPLSGWQAHCGCDAHSNYYASSTVNSDGSLQSGSPARNSGVNLSSFSIVPLNSSTSAGSTQIPVARPSSGAWDVGAYQFVAASCGSYSHCRTITFDHTKAGSSDTSNYVALISGNYTYLAVTGSGGFVQHTTTQTPGGATITVPADVVYTTDQGCSLLLKWEYETYSSTTGTIRAHVNIGTLSHTADTTIYECAGNAGVTTWQGDVPGTWVNYMLVQHLPDGSTLTAKDSAHSNNGTIVGVTATTGQIDGAGSFPGGAGNLITVSDNASLSNPAGPLTMSGWYNAATPTTDDGGIVQKSPNLTQGEYFLGPLGSFGNRIYCFILDQTTGGYIGRFSSQPPTGWHYIVCTYNGGTTNSSVGIWSDGVQIDTNNFGAGTFVQMRDTTQPVLIGGAHSAIGGPLTAVADEIRVSSVDRTGSITAEYNNQLNPLTFYTVGPDLAPSSSARRRMLL